MLKCYLIVVLILFSLICCTQTKQSSDELIAKQQLQTFLEKRGMVISSYFSILLDKKTNYDFDWHRITICKFNEPNIGALNHPFKLDTLKLNKIGKLTITENAISFEPEIGKKMMVNEFKIDFCFNTRIMVIEEYKL